MKRVRGPIVLNPKGQAPAFTMREDRYVGIDQVAKALQEKRRLIIADARAPSDYLNLHIAGAISTPHYDKKALDDLPNDGTWVVAYCACPHHASGEVVDALRAKKYPHTAVMDEGILFWKDHGYPLVGEAVTAAAPASAAPSARKPPAHLPKPALQAP